MDLFGKKLNSLGQGLLGLIIVYGIFALAGISVYNFMLIPLIAALIFFGFEEETPKSNDDKDSEKDKEG